MADKIGNVTIEGARILFRNFSGEEGRYNAKGKRNFNVLLAQDLADLMEKDGWNVKYLQPREEDEAPQARLEVAVSFGKNPPRIVLITSRGKTNLDESMVSLLDWADIENVDMIVRPYNWDVNGKTGIKAYVKSLYVTIREDELELKYLDVPDSGQSAIMAPEEPEDE
jgi:hypothetical protein